jgi:hypothetical protein
LPSPRAHYRSPGGARRPEARGNSPLVANCAAGAFRAEIFDKRQSLPTWVNCRDSFRLRSLPVAESTACGEYAWGRVCRCGSGKPLSSNPKETISYAVGTARNGSCLRRLHIWWPLTWVERFSSFTLASPERTPSFPSRNWVSLTPPSPGRQRSRDPQRPQ